MKSVIVLELGFMCYFVLAVNADSLTQNRPEDRWKEIIFDTDSESEIENEIEVSEDGRYVPTWESLDSRPMPEWYDAGKIGIFIHWGVFSVPAYQGAWFWENWALGNPTYVNYMKANYPPKFTYQDFGPMFTAEFYEPHKWADLFAKAGARYVVLTGKHHEGYTMWPSKYNFGWNVRDVGPQRDLVGDLANAIRNTTLKFGLYHSLYEWFNPLYMYDRNNSYKTDLFVTSKTMPELYEIVNTYKPEVVWSDGDWDASADYWKSKEFLAWLYNDSPVKDTVVTNDRWGAGCMCKHGGVMTCRDRYNPGVLIPKKWENCMTLDRDFWAFRRNAQIKDFLTPEELMKTVIETVSCGGNVLINVGPTKEGIIIPVQEERLLQLGEWLGINGEAIYETVPWKAQNDSITPGVWYTSRPAEKKVFAMALAWPGNQIQLGSVDSTIVKSVQVLGAFGYQKWSVEKVGITVQMPRLDTVSSRWAWTILINTK